MRAISMAMLALSLLAWLPVRSVLALEVTTGSRSQRPRETRPELTEAQREQIWVRIRSNRAALQKAGTLPSEAQMAPLAPPTLILPLAPKAGYTDPGFFAISGFVDHDPTYPVEEDDYSNIEDYECGDRSYDLTDGYNHSGTDYYPWPFAWELMDSDSVEIVAAAAGTIIGKDEPPGNYDRNCDWDDIQGDGWNAVYIQHADGSIAWYGHMKTGSLTTKLVGQTVTQGEMLGTVGSSGFSSGPHLHFELYADADETTLIDPYAGPCNLTTATSWWASQPPYRDSQINRLMTASGGPTWPDDYCSNDPDLTKDTFFPNDPIYFTALYRDELEGQTSTFTVYRPDDSIFATYNHTATETPFYGDSFVTMSDTIPSNPQFGTWGVEVVYQGVTYSHDFEVIDTGGINPQTAVYDAGLGAPSCSIVGSSCDSASLLFGRGIHGSNSGPELNQPNTIDGCGDGDGYWQGYPNDETAEAIRVWAVDGGHFTSGEDVDIEVDFLAWSGYTGDYVDVYYTSDANSPSWQFLGSMAATQGGVNTMVINNHTLSSDNLQAIRAHSRYEGIATSCSTDQWSDHDDLVFAVGGPALTADFSASVTAGAAPLLVAFSDLSTGAPTSWLWDFGDSGATSTEQNPTFEYVEPGSYSVSLTATNASGSDMLVRSDYIFVPEPGALLQLVVGFVCLMGFHSCRRNR